MGLINGARRAPSPKAAERTPLLQCQGRSAAAPRASASTFAGSSGPAGTTQLPPTHRTASSASHSGAVAALMPPVGQKPMPPNGPVSALSAATPPLVDAGKNLKLVSPMSRPAMMFDALALRSEEHTAEFP